VTGTNNDHYATYNGNGWGLTACDNLPPPGSNLLSEYYSFGALPTEQNIRSGTEAPHIGTIAAYGPGSAINFLPNESVAALREFYAVPGLWHELFGLGDAYSLDPHYFEADANGAPVLANNGG